MGISDGLKLPEVQRLEEIYSRREAIRDALQSGEIKDPQIKGAYEMAIEQLDAEAAPIARDPEIQSHYASLAEEAAKSMEQLKLLEGVLPESQLDSMREDFKARFFSAAEIVRNYGPVTPEATELVERSPLELAVRSTTVVIPTPEPQPTPEPEADPPPEADKKPKTKVLVIFDEGTVRLGRHGRLVRLSKRNNEEQRDYSSERRAALEFLVRHQDEELTPYQIWEGIFTGEFDKKVFEQVSNWLKSLTFRGQKLLLSNGKRGIGSRYQVNPLLDLQLAPLKSSQKAEAAIENLDLGDLYVVVRHLKEFNPIIKAKGCDPIDVNWEQGLKNFQPDYSHLSGNEDAIWASRSAAMERALAVLDDEQRLDTFIKGVLNSSPTNYEDQPEYQFVDYLHGLSEDHRTLMRKLIRAKIEREPVSHEHMRLWAVDAKDRTIVIAVEEIPLENGSHKMDDFPPSVLEELLASEKTTDASSPELGKNISDSNAETSTQPHPLEEDEIISVPRPGEGRVVGEATNDRTAQTMVREFKKQERHRLEPESKLVRLETIAYGLAVAFLDDLSPEGEYKQGIIQNTFPKFTARNVASAKDNRVVRREDHTQFSLEDTVRILIYTNPKLRNIYMSHKYKGAIDEIIQRAIKNALADKKKDPSKLGRRM